MGALVLLDHKAIQLLLGAAPLAHRRRSLKVALAARPREAAGSHPHRPRLERSAPLYQAIQQLAIVTHHYAYAVKAAQRRHEARSRGGVDVVGGLIQHQHVRLRPQRAGDLELFLLPT